MFDNACKPENGSYNPTFKNPLPLKHNDGSICACTGAMVWRLNQVPPSHIGSIVRVSAGKFLGHRVRDNEWTYFKSPTDALGFILEYPVDGEECPVCDKKTTAPRTIRKIRTRTPNPRSENSQSAERKASDDASTNQKDAVGGSDA